MAVKMAVKMACILLVLTGTGATALLCKNNDLYDTLWDESLDIAEATLREDFLQRMQGARLSAGRYTTFFLQDIYYLVEVTAMLKEMKDTVQKPDDVKRFFAKRYKSYQTYTNDVLKEYHLKDASSIVPGPAITSYLQTYRDTMELDPIYFAVAMLPCVRLWPYLAKNLDIKNNTAYYEWKRDNGHSNADKHYRPLLTKYSDSIDWEIATGLFRKQMEHEREFFEEAIKPRGVIPIETEWTCATSKLRDQCFFPNQ